MNKRVTSLLASIALGLVALTGCSTNAGAPAGDVGNRVPMVRASDTAAPAQTP